MRAREKGEEGRDKMQGGWSSRNWAMRLWKAGRLRLEVIIGVLVRVAGGFWF